MNTYEPNNIVLIIDFNNTMFRALHAMKSLSHDGIPTGGIFGFITQTCAAINKYLPARIIVCDDRKPYIRCNLFPEYKQNRKYASTPEEKEVMKHNRNGVQQFCNALNIPIWSVQGYEADDLIAQYCVAAQFDGLDPVILSNDDDLYQLLIHDNVTILKKNGEYRAADFVKEFGIEPVTWMHITALSGTHNAVPGIPKVGIKTAIKMVTQPWEPKYQKKITEFSKIIERNKKLIKIPYHECDFISNPPPHPVKIEYNEKEMFNLFRDNNMRINTAMQQAFQFYKPARDIKSLSRRPVQPVQPISSNK